jgi:uncharacterized membrane protein YfcA
LVDTLGIVGLTLGLIATAAGAAAQAAIGMGFNLFAAPLLALIDPVFVPGPILMHGFLLSIVASWRLRADINVREVGISACGLLGGTAIAAIGLSLLDPASLPRVFGGLVLVAVGITAAGGSVPLSVGSILVASGVAGVMGTVAGVHGPPIALLYQRETPARIRSALLPFFVFANALSLLALASIGMLGWREVAAAALLVPGLAVGFLASPWLVRVMSPGAIRASILAISAASGLALMIRG